MIKFHCLALLAASVASSPIEIINYKDAEAGHGQVMSGIPGEAVTGEFYWNAPEGEAIRLVYTADMGGYVATGEHLPVSPELTPEVMEARTAFMEKFDEEKARAVDMEVENEILTKMIEDEIVEEIVEAEVAEVIEEALGLRTVEPNHPEKVFEDESRRRRDADADADAQIFLTQPLHYAPNYPYHYVNNLLPTLKKVEDAETINLERKVEDMPMMDDIDRKDEDMKKFGDRTYLPVYAPSYYYPQPVVQYPAVTTTVTQRVGNWYPVSNLQYPLAYPGLVSQVGVRPPKEPQVTNERILPAQPQAGEDESAALLL